MRRFFINAFEVLLGILMVLWFLLTVAMAGLAAFGDALGGPVATTPEAVIVQTQPSNPGEWASYIVNWIAGSDLATGLLILVAGLALQVFIGGLLYLLLGIYRATAFGAVGVQELVRMEY
ncbi:MAG: hypothetical protein ACU0DW_02250 [Shimia sp.]